ncbi:Cytochrome P450 [Phytophthora megakarya]|uniref:Cytochrome P450 n=1 Tax=Phytophthora megakarya TaxID=4795 RepID=A0A225VRW0_9STRA|nr:Cytochrome P450 [Phytophthora megakarya]
MSVRLLKRIQQPQAVWHRLADLVLEAAALAKVGLEKQMAQDIKVTNDVVSIIRAPLPPKITSISHDFLASWKVKRREYEAEMRARCIISGEDYAIMTTPIKESFNSDLLETFCELRLNMAVEDVTEGVLIAELEYIVGSVKNKTLPNIKGLFKNKLRLNMKESDVYARVLDYFNEFGKVVGANGLTECFNDNDGRCKNVSVLVASLHPALLKDEVKYIQLTHKPAATYPRLFFELIVEKATEKDRQYQRSKTREREQPEGKKKKPVGKSEHDEKKKVLQQLVQLRSPIGRSEGKTRPKPSTSPYLKQSPGHYAKQVGGGVHQGCAHEEGLKLMRDFVISFLVTERETTATTMTWIILMLNRYPKVLGQIRQELNDKLPDLFTDLDDIQQIVYVEAVVRGTLRLFPVVSFSERSAKRDVRPYDGTFIKAGTCPTMLWVEYQLYVDAFKPERWIDPATNKIKVVSPFKFSVFLGGPRMCIDTKFALAEVKITLAKLLSQFDFRTVKDPVDFAYKPSLTLQVEGPLDVAVYKLKQK